LAESVLRSFGNLFDLFVPLEFHKHRLISCKLSGSNVIVTRGAPGKLVNSARSPFCAYMTPFCISIIIEHIHHNRMGISCHGTLPRTTLAVCTSKRGLQASSSWRSLKHAIGRQMCWKESTRFQGLATELHEPARDRDRQHSAANKTMNHSCSPGNTA
jgi:hypothetical protein